MFEAEPGHLLVHVTTLTPLLICNCPQPVRNTTLGFGWEERGATYAVCILKPHSCLHTCVCYSTRSRFQEFCFRCNNLILVGQPGRWKQQTAQNGLSLLVSLAKGLCPSRLHLQQTANPVHVRGPQGPTAPPQTDGGCLCLCTDPWALLTFSFLNKKTHVTDLIFESKFPVNSPPLPLRPHTSWQDASQQLQLHMLILKNRWKWNHCDSMLQSRQRQPRAWWKWK